MITWSVLAEELDRNGNLLLLDKLFARLLFFFEVIPRQLSFEKIDEHVPQRLKIVSSPGF
jgi:hypothetical protein